MIRSNKDEELGLLETIMENTRTQLAYLDNKFNFVKVNSAYAKGSGHSKKELLGKNHFELFPDKENEKIFKSVIKTGKPVSFYRKPFEFPDQPKRGITYWDWTLKPIKDNQGKITGLVFSLNDVTNEVRSDQELEQEKQRAQQLALEAEGRAGEMDAVFSAMTDALIVYNLTRVAVAANPAAHKFFGIEVVGKTREEIAVLSHVRDLDGRPAVQGSSLISTKAFTGSLIASQYYLMTNAQGEETTQTVTASPITREGKVAGVVVIFHDVTERFRLEKQKDAIIAIVSHELKTPITTLKALIQILDKLLNGTTPQAKIFIKKIIHQVENLSTLVSQILDANKFEAESLKLSKKKFFLDQLIKEVAEGLQPIFNQHQLVLKLSPISVLGDQERLSQVLTNLIVNAVKYSPGAKKVVISQIQGQDQAQVSVRDFGIGIPKKYQGKIFERFFRIGGPKGERFQGLGLGLYICSEIIKLHNGKITVKSQVGKGSTFSFTLPNNDEKSFGY